MLSIKKSVRSELIRGVLAHSGRSKSRYDWSNAKIIYVNEKRYIRQERYSIRRDKLKNGIFIEMDNRMDIAYHCNIFHSARRILSQSNIRIRDLKAARHSVMMTKCK